MSNYAFIEDVYETRLSNLDNDYDKIVENILGIKTKQKYNLTTKDKPSEFTNEIEIEEEKPVEKPIEKPIEKPVKKTIEKPKIENFNDVTIAECEDFLKHLEKCQRCRMFLIKKFNLDKKPEDLKREQYLDIIIFALSGVFVLFFIDIILNFGKNLKK